MQRVLIIEDEIKTAKELKTLIENHNDEFEVVDILATVKDSLKWFEENEMPDLIFSDIQLADGLSFDIYKQTEITAPIIFCTAFDEYAINAFDVNGIDYLLKPIDDQKLEHGLDKYSKLRTTNQPTSPEQYNDRLNQMIEQVTSPYKTNILVYVKDKILPINTNSIVYINSDNGIVTLWLEGNMRYIVNYTLDTLMEMLNPAVFYKANRQFIINKNFIKSIERYFTRRLVVRLTTPTEEDIVISKVKATEFLKWVENY